MKRTRNIYGGLTLAAAALLCLAGCKKDEEGEKVVLGVDFEQTAGMQKTYIGNGDKTIYWSTDDQVQVNGTNYLVHDGVVEVNMCDDGYAAVYPATATLISTGKTCTGGTVVIPATQNYVKDDNGIQQLNGPMAARLDTKTGRLLFRNLYAVVKVTVTAGSTPFILSSITVESTNSKNLSGTQEFTFGAATNTAVPTLGNLSNGSNRVVLTDIDSTIPANNSASFYLYTAEFSGADLTIRLNRTASETGHARSGIGISRSQLRGTTVNAGSLTPDPEPIDLGLSVIWAPCNVGADNPWETGDYFAWGETEPRNNFGTMLYNPVIFPDTLPAEADAAHVKWGGKWRMPTASECEELKNAVICEWVWVENYQGSGINGHLVTSKVNGHTDQCIFLPAVGYYNGALQYNAWHGYLTSSFGNSNTIPEQIYVMHLVNDENKGHVSLNKRHFGFVVRPVKPNPNYQPQSN